jgi:ATP-dependent helicase/nuclease subunit B
MIYFGKIFIAVPTTNKFPAAAPRQIRELAEICRRQPLAEKWLLCPSRRIGQQWLDHVARAGQPVVNVHLHTRVTLALQLAGARLGDRRLLSPLARVILAGQLLRQLGAGYLGSLRPSLALAERLAATLHDLRLAGVDPDALAAGRFEAPAKGRELVQLLRAFRQMLADHNLVDEADLYRLAGAELPAGVTLLVPADLDLGPLKKLPHTLLPVDEPPAPEFTDTFSAVGETNEIREALRRCLANGWPLDEVEILHTDSAAYLPRLVEVTETLGIPATFAEGVPVSFTRPGRALAAFLAWIRDDYPQTALLAMVRDGLLREINGAAAGALRPVPIGFGRDRYLAQLDHQIAALGRQADRAATDEAGDPRPDRVERLRRRQATLANLREPLAKLLACAARAPLDAAREFLTNHVRCVGELDNYAREVLEARIAELSEWLTTHELDEREWLLSLLAETRVRGEGPRPGHLYVARWEAGGQTGRGHTFILGLDAGRFPPQSRQDPVLLDSERAALAAELPTAESRRQESQMAFDRLRARLRGTVTVSFTSRTLTDDTEQAAGLTLPKAAVATTAPATGTAALTDAEWWLWRLCAAEPVVEPSRLAGECFPWLQRGLHAAAKRAGKAFTEFDGHVPEAGNADEVFSAHRLEMAGACPLRYFFRYALRIEPPEELELDADRWLPPLEFGLLLHDVFCRHLRDGVPLEAALRENIAKWQEAFPPPSAGVLRRDCRRMERALRIFAAEPRAGTPIDFEKEVPAQAIGLPDGTVLRVRGRIDRVDETPGGLELWDYKTGSTSWYDKKPPFNGGRILQHALYMAIAEKFYGRPVTRFAYYFPTEKGRGETVAFTPGELVEAPGLLARLRQLIATGQFHATTEADDCHYCDYRGICRDFDAVTEASQRKQSA